MATPTFTHDLTTITDGETVTGWVAVGGAMFALDPDTFIQGSNSIGIPATANTVVGAVFNRGSTVDLTDKHLFIWINAAVQGKVASFNAGGLRIRVAGPTATNYGEWFVGGKDIPWASEGKWRLIVIDCNRTYDATGGTPPAITAIQHIGVTTLTTAALMQGFAVNIDIMRYGTKFGVSGGSAGNPVTFQDIYNQDFEIDPVNNVFGLVTKNRAGTFEINGELRLGIESGAGNTVFSSQNELVIFQDQPCALDYLKILTQQGSGTTDVKFGTGTGTGDDRVGLNGVVFDRINTFFGREYSLDMDASINLIEFYGSTVLRAKRGVALPAATGHELISSQFVGCGQISLGQVLARKCVFSGHGLVTTGATTLDVTANSPDTGAGITIGTNVARTYTRSAGGSGSFITDGFLPKMVITISGCTTAANNGVKVIQSVTATVITVYPSQVLVTEAGSGDERILVPFAYTRASGSFVTDGFVADNSIITSAFTTAGNNSTHVIATVEATRITVRHNTGMAAETGGGDEVLQKSGITGDGALLWNGSIDIENSSFLGNTNTAATTAAIEHPAQGTFDYVDLTFSGNDFDINYTAAASSGVLTINATGTSNPTTSKILNPTGNSVSIVASVPIDVTVVDSDNSPVADAQVYIQKSAVGKSWNYTSHDTNNLAGDATFEVNEVVDTDLPQSGWLHVLDVSANTKQEYRYSSWSGKIFTLPTEVTGTADAGGSATTLIDSAGSFTTVNIEEGDTIRNTTDTGAWAVVDEIVSATELTTSALQGGTTNTWAAGDTYSFHKLALTYVNTDLVDIPIFNGQTDTNGEISTTYSGTSLAILVRIRSNHGVTKYIPFNTSGNITASGFSLTAVLTEDTVAT